VEEEYLTISNPLDEEVCVADYVLIDSKHLHAFKFPRNTMIPSKSVLYVYTCPAGNHQSDFNEPNVLWKNNDGSLRRKEALNNRKFFFSNSLFLFP
jgi:hypothetical protein